MFPIYRKEYKNWIYISPQRRLSSRFRTLVYKKLTGLDSFDVWQQIFGACVQLQATSATTYRSAAWLVHSCCETSSLPTFLSYQSLAIHTELQHYITFLLTKILVWVSQTVSCFNSKHYIVTTCQSPTSPPRHCCHLVVGMIQVALTVQLAKQAWRVIHGITTSSFGWGSVPTPGCAILKTKTRITYCSLLNLAIAITATQLH